MVKIGLTIQEFQGIPPSTWIRLTNAVGISHIEFDRSVFDDIESVLPKLKPNVTIHAPYCLDYGYDLSSVGTSGEKADLFIKQLQIFSQPLKVEGVVVHPPDDPDGSNEIFLKRINQINNPIFLENMPDQPWRDFIDFFTLVESKLNKHLGFCFDIPHSYIANGESLLDVPDHLLKELTTKRGYVHISGGMEDQDLHLPLNQGTLPLSKILKFFQDINFQGTIVMELRPQKFEDINSIIDSYLIMMKLLPITQKIRFRLRLALGRRFVVNRAKKHLSSNTNFSSTNMSGEEQ